MRRSDYLDGLRSAYPGKVAGIALEDFGRASLAGLDASADRSAPPSPPPKFI